MEPPWRFELQTYALRGSRVGVGWERLLLLATARLPAGDRFVWPNRGLRGHLGDTAFSPGETSEAGRSRSSEHAALASLARI